MKKFKIGFASLAFALLAGIAAASCSEPAGVIGADAQASGIEPMENGSFGPTPENAALPDIDLGGAEFMFATRSYEHGAGMFESRELYAEEQNGDSINDAVYARNLSIEEKYNCAIKENKLTLPAGSIKNSLKAGDGTYDAVLDSAMYLRPLAEEMLLADMSELEYANLENSYWDQGAVEGFTIGGSLYFCVGELNIMAKDCTWVTLFNKKAAEDFAMPNFYQLVRDGKWTLDIFHQCAKDATKDLDGDGEMTESDQWGHAGEYYNFFVHMIGCGARYSMKNEKDYPEAAIYTDKNIAIADKVFSVMADQRTTVLANDYAGKYPQPWHEVTFRAFEESRVLFLVSGLVTVTYNFRDMETPFGVLPIPKWDESQEKYYATVSMGNMSAVAISASGDKVVETAFVVEALQAVSLATLKEAYYDVTLTHKGLRDDDSKEMLDLVFQNRVYDTAMVYDWGGWMNIFHNICKTKKNTFASDYEKMEDKINNALEQMVSQYAKTK